MRTAAILSVLAAGALIAARACLVYPALPSTMASHFDAAGRADGWSSKQSLLGIMAAVTALLAAVGLGIPFLIGVLPVSWLAPERAAATRAVLQTYLAWFSAATLVLLAAVLELTYQANLAAAAGAEQLSNHVWTAFGSYLLFTAVWLVCFVRRFQR